MHDILVQCKPTCASRVCCPSRKDEGSQELHTIHYYVTETLGIIERTVSAFVYGHPRERLCLLINLEELTEARVELGWL